MVKVLIKKLDPKVQLPIYKTEGSSGMDLKAFTDKSIKIFGEGLDIRDHLYISDFCNLIYKNTLYYIM